MLRRWIAIAPLALPLLAGCVHFSNSPHDPNVWRLSDQAPQESKSCVYVFMVEPMNPLTESLSGLSDHLHCLGYIKTFCGKPAHRTYFAEKMQWLRGRSEAARFVIIGYDSAAGSAQQLAIDAEAAGVPVDIVLLIEPTSGDFTSTPNALVIRPNEMSDESEPQELHRAGHSKKHNSVITHPRTLAIVERELTLIAMTVPPPKRPAERQVTLVEKVPPPRAKEPHPRELPEEWQFLRPKFPWEMPPDAPRHGNQILPPPKALPELPLPKEKS